MSIATKRKKQITVSETYMLIGINCDYMQSSTFLGYYLDGDLEKPLPFVAVINEYISCRL